MSNYNGVYAAFESNQTITTGDVLVELQVPANTQIEVIRMWVSPGYAATPIDEIQKIDIYTNDAVGTGGTALTETKYRGSADGTSAITALGGPTIGATPTVVYPDQFHLLQGWLYLPVPEERIRIAGGTTEDNIGFRFTAAPETSTVVSYGVVWGELG